MIGLACKATGKAYQDFLSISFKRRLFCINISSINEVSNMLLSLFRTKKIAQVEGYNRFEYIRETDSAVIVSRENGEDTVVPIAKIKLAIEAVRNDPSVYDRGPNSLREHGITHLNSPIWAILHLANLSELID